MAHGPALATFTIKSLAAALILTVCMMMGPSPAQAQTKSEWPVAYLAGFAFFKYANVEPDFRTWVFNSDAYQNGTPHERANMLRSEVPRLQSTFDSYVINDHPIAIKTPVTISVPSPSTAKKMVKETGIVTIPIKLQQSTGSLFAIQVSDMWIALIPEDLDDMLKIEFTEEEYTGFKKATSDMGLNNKSQVQLSLRLLPLQADTREPLVIDEVQLWMLLAKVISFELRSADGTKVIWYRGIEGYDKQNSNQDIYNLFKD